MIEYATLRIIWWVLLGVLLAGFAVMDGFDLGVAALLPFIARTDQERRIVINTVGPVWEGNQVWIILGAGAIFAAWPVIYAVSFSGFYLAMFLLLLTFIMRPVGFKYRSKLPHQRWRSFWDWGLSIAAIISALVFGVAVGNVLQGVPFHFGFMNRAFYTGGFWSLFNPFALLCGVLSLAMLLMHGAVYLIIKTSDLIEQRARNTVFWLATITVLLFGLAGFCVTYLIKGYLLTMPIDVNGPSSLAHLSVVRQAGAWTRNFGDHPWMALAPLLGFLGALFVILLRNTKRTSLLFICSAISVFGIVATVGVSMFPFILPSSSDMSASLLVWNGSSSKATLEIMLFSTVIFMPLILIYTSWVFWVLRGKVTKDSISKNDQAY